jgi:hypothetical protein
MPLHPLCGESFHYLLFPLSRNGAKHTAHIGKILPFRLTGRTLFYTIKPFTERVKL